MKTILLTICIATIAAASAFAAPESFYRDAWAAQQGGQAEVRMPDGTRCDVVTSTHAVEVDFAPKWCEAIGQSLYYALQTNKQPGILLVLRRPEDRKFLIRLNSTIRHYNLPIKVWVWEVQ